MKPGVILVNVARGDLVDPGGAGQRLAKGPCLGRGARRLCAEPIPADHPVLRLENAILFAHIASASVKAVRTLRETAAGIVAKAIRGEPLPNIVNGVG